MRRGYRYTTKDAPIVSGTTEEYRRYLTDQPLRVRITWRLAAAFHRVGVARYTRERLLRGLLRELSSTDSGVFDRSGDGLTDLFFRHVDAMKRSFAAVQRATLSAVDTRRSEFLRFIVCETQPETCRSVMEASRQRFDFSQINERPLEDVRDTIVDAVRVALLPARGTPLQSGPGAVWSAIDLVTEIANFPIKSVLPTPSLEQRRNEPLRPFLPALIRLEHISDRCRRTLKSDALSLFDRWAGASRELSVSEAVRAAATAIDALRGEALIRYGLSDPLATFRWPQPELDLYEETVDAFIDVVTNTVASEALRQAEETVSPYLDATIPLPEGIPRATVTAVLNFFKDPGTERTIRELFEAVIDGEFSDSMTAIRLHQLVNAAEEARGTLTRLFHSSESRTADVERGLHRRTETVEKPLLREQRRRMYLINVTRQVEVAVADLSSSLIAICELLQNEDAHPLGEAVSGWKRFGTGLLNLLRVEQRR